MRHDPIVEEARQAGQAYIESFKGDRAALIADLRRRSEAEGKKPISRPPKRPKMLVEKAPRVG